MNRDILFSILLATPYEDLISFCRTSRLTYNICQSEYFWQQKALRDLGTTPEEFKLALDRYRGDTPRSVYLRLLTETGTCSIGSELLTNVNLCLRDAYARNNQRLIDYFLRTERYSILLGLIEAAHAGDLNLALYHYNNLLDPYGNQNESKNNLRFVLLEAGLLNHEEIYNTFAKIAERPSLEETKRIAQEYNLPFNEYLYINLSDKYPLYRSIGSYGHPDTVSLIFDYLDENIRSNIISWTLSRDNIILLKYLKRKINLRSYLDQIISRDDREKLLKIING